MICQNSEKQKSPQYANALSKIIKTLRNSSGQTQKICLQKARKQFCLSDDEKYVVTKLRLILVRLGADIDKLQIRKTGRNGVQAKTKFVAPTSVKERRTAINVEKETVMMRAQRIRAIKDSYFSTTTNNNESKKSTQNFKKVCTQETKIKKRRQSLEERQLAKLRSKTFKDDEVTTNASRLFHSSKLEFLCALNLVPNDVVFEA